MTLRFGLPSALIVAGFVILFTVDGSLRWDGWAMCVGSALALAFFSVVFHLGKTGDLERDDEEAARRHYKEHGHWPGEGPTTPRA